MALYERETFPRAHVGESLLPATLAVLDDIGVLPAIEAEGFVRKAGATMSWGRDDAPWSWYFAETNRRYPHSYQVWRPRFDQILLEHSARCGVRVHQGVAVQSVHEDGVRLADGEHVDAALVVDATGQNALIASARGMKEWDAFFRNLAVYGYYAGGAHLDPPDDGNIFIEAYEHGWLWKIRWPAASRAWALWWTATSARPPSARPVSKASFATRWPWPPGPPPCCAKPNCGKVRSRCATGPTAPAR